MLEEKHALEERVRLMARAEHHVAAQEQAALQTYKSAVTEELQSERREHVRIAEERQRTELERVQKATQDISDQQARTAVEMAREIAKLQASAKAHAEELHAQTRQHEEEFAKQRQHSEQEQQSNMQRMMDQLRDAQEKLTAAADRPRTAEEEMAAVALDGLDHAQPHRLPDGRVLHPQQGQQQAETEPC